MGSIRRTQVVLLGVLAATGLLVAWLALRTRQAPVLPPDDVHATFTGAEACQTCHGPDGGFPQSPNHPLGFDCLRCHGTR